MDIILLGETENTKVKQKLTGIPVKINKVKIIRNTKKRAYLNNQKDIIGYLPFSTIE